MKFSPQNHSPAAQTFGSAAAQVSKHAERSSLMTVSRLGSRRYGRLGGLRYGALALLLAACWLHAQEPDAPGLTNTSPEGMISGLTNEAMQVEELISAIRSIVPGDALPEEANGTNGPSEEPATNEGGPGSPADSQAWRRPSGRESRSRWSSRQRSNSAWSSYNSGSALAGPTNNAGPRSLDYATFRLIVDRNIFDPNRRPNHPRDYTPPPPRGPAAEYFTLVGTMSYSEGTFAFFNGSSSDYQTSLKSGANIAGYKVTAIGSDSVKLAQGTNQLDLRIGMQMRHDEDGSWSKSEAPTSYTVSSFEPPPGSNSAASPGNASSGPESEILRRLMEKREKE